MGNITSQFGEPAAAFLLPVHEVSDLSTSGKGVVYDPQFLDTTDFSDAGEDVASVSGKTFEANGNNYFDGQCIRLGGNDGTSYVVTSVGGTTGTDTITVDREIEESNGTDIFISQYLSMQYGVRDDTKSYIFPVLKSGYSGSQLSVITANGKELTDFNPNTLDDISLFPLKKIVRNDNNYAPIYACKAF